MNQQQLLQIGMIVVFVGIIVIFTSFLFAPKEGKTDAKFSVFGVFGFIPFGFSNDKRLFVFSIIITLVLIVMSIFFFINSYKIMK